MKHSKRIFFTSIIFLFLGIVALKAQLPEFSDAQIKAELKERNLSEEEVTQALNDRGYDINNLENLTQAELLEIKSIIEELSAQQSIDAPQENETSIKNLKETDSVQDTLIPEVEEIFEEITEDEEVEVNTYGQQLFRNKTIRVYQQSEEIKAPDNYILGVGDELAISIFGNSILDEEHTITKDGFISIRDGYKRIYLKGLSLEQARKKLDKNYRQFYNYKKGEFAVTLNYSRTIQVSVYGEVLNQGPITIPAINTAFSALVAVNGPTNLGSVRNIKLIRSSGEIENLDVYEYISNPSIAKNYYLNDGDYLHVPVAQKIVELKGAVNRPMKYELKEGEGIIEAIEFAGGMSKNAIKKTIKVNRFGIDQNEILTIPYAQVLASRSNYDLENGDVLDISTISQAAKNYISLSGAFKNPGDYERTPNMKVVDAINLAGISDNAETSRAYIQRLATDGTYSYLEFDYRYVLNNISSPQNYVLQDRDKIILYSKNTFADQISFSVRGAVRNPDQFEFDSNQNLRISDAIYLSGGLRRDASSIAYVQRVDSLLAEPNYVVLDLDEIVNNPESDQNIKIRPFDRLTIYQKDVFYEKAFIGVGGAVNEPGTFPYGEDMTVKDALVLAQGLKIAAALDKVEISRVIIKNNEPTKTIIASIEIDRDLNVISTDQEFKLAPFDIIQVRYVPEFELQEFVELQGQVKYAGKYPIINKNERISSIINRAGGINEDAFPEGATLYRAQDNIGNVIIKLADILEDRKSKFNFTVRDGDVILIPKKKEFVTIRGATRVRDFQIEDNISSGNSISVPFHKGKTAKFYIDEYAGGIDSDLSSGKYVYVEQPNGQIERSKFRFPLGRKYPKVMKGSTIVVKAKPAEVKKEEEEKEDVDWTKILSDTVVQATSVLTLILLARQLN